MGACTGQSIAQLTRLAPTKMLVGAVTALRASACWAGPLLLAVLALGGAWGSRLTALRPSQPYFSPFLLLSSRWARTGSTPGPKHVRSDEWQRLTTRDNPRT